MDPTADLMPTEAHQRARAIAQAPGTLLVITGALHMAAFAALTVMPTLIALGSVLVGMGISLDTGSGSDEPAGLIMFGLSGFCGAIGLANLLFCVLSAYSTLLGGLHYRRLESYGRARMACISALLLPIIALPFGIGSYVFGCVILMPSVAIGIVAGVVGMLYVFDEKVANEFEYR